MESGASKTSRGWTFLISGEFSDWLEKLYCQKTLVKWGLPDAGLLNSDLLQSPDCYVPEWIVLMWVKFNANVQTTNNKFFLDELSFLLGICDCKVSLLRFSPAANLVCCFFSYQPLSYNLFSLGLISPRELRCAVLASVYLLHLCSFPRGQGSATELPQFDRTICLIVTT